MESAIPYERKTPVHTLARFLRSLSPRHAHQPEPTMEQRLETLEKFAAAVLEDAPSQAA